MVLNKGSASANMRWYQPRLTLVIGMFRNYTSVMHSNLPDRTNTSKAAGQARGSRMEGSGGGAGRMDR